MFAHRREQMRFVVFGNGVSVTVENIGGIVYFSVLHICRAARNDVCSELFRQSAYLFFYPLSVSVAKAFKIFSRKKTRVPRFGQNHRVGRVFFDCAFDEFFCFCKIFVGSGKEHIHLYAAYFHFLSPHSRCLIIFPLTVFGNSALNSTIRGYL